MRIRSFFDPRTATLTYVVSDEKARSGVVIDPVLDFDRASGRTWTESADAVASFIDAERLSIPYVLDTHVHADHLSGIAVFKDRFGAKTVIGEGVVEVQRAFGSMFDLGDDFVCDGSQFDLLVKDGDRLRFGRLELEAIHTPGHTPACMTYRVEDALFVGDTLFQPDYGTARCDFPAGSADELYTSITALYDRFDGTTRTFTCHDYQPGGRDVEYESTLAEQMRSNVQLSGSTTRSEFLAFRNARDEELAVPELILPSIQVNVRAGELPPREKDGISYLKLPLNVLGRRS